jgi:GT2 family glycosyltransferase
LQACAELDYPNFEVIVVDNDPESPLEFPKNLLSREWKLITSSENLGFAGGNNTGIQVAQGEFICFVNNDTCPTPDFLDLCIEPFVQDSPIGAISPMIVYANTDNLIQYAGYTEINPWTGRNAAIGKGQPVQEKFLQAGETAYLHGAAMMVRREVIETVGNMPEDYFLYYEELDWSLKIRRAGYKILYYPKAKIYHRASLSVGEDSVLKTYYYHRNRILFMRKNTSGVSLLGFMIYTLMIIIPKYTLTFILKGKWRHLQAFWRGIIWHITHTATKKQSPL